MLTGSGMMANAFSAYEDRTEFIVFARGVADSKNASAEDFRREEAHLMPFLNDHDGKTLVYFSTISIHDPLEADSPYVRHKLRMEERVRDRKGPAIIFRLPQLVGHSGNSKTILNFLVGHIREGIEFELWTGAVRNIMDMDDAYRVMDMYLGAAEGLEKTIEIHAPRNIAVTKLVGHIEDHLGKKGRYTKVDKGEPWHVDAGHLIEVYGMLGIQFAEGYIPSLLEKYYPRTD